MCFGRHTAIGLVYLACRALSFKKENDFALAQLILAIQPRVLFDANPMSKKIRGLYRHDVIHGLVRDRNSTKQELLKIWPVGYSMDDAIVQEKTDALCDAFAGDYENMIRAVRQNPAVLRAPAATMKGAWAALLEAFQGDVELTRAVVKKNPAVLAAPAATVEGSWAALLEVFQGDVELTRAVVKQTPAMLRSPAVTVEGSWAALLEVFHDDVELTRAVVKQNPAMLTAPAATVKGSWAALLEVFQGDVELIRAVVKKNPAMLTAPAATVEGSWAALLEVFQGDVELIRAVVKKNPAILRSPAATVEGSWAALLEVFQGDVELTRAVVKQCPSVLKARAKTIQSSWDSLCNLVYGGNMKAATSLLVHGSPGYLCSTTIHNSMMVLEKLLGNLSLARSVVYTQPIVLKSRAATLEACWEALVEELGKEQTQSIVIKDPRVLCSSSNRFQKLWSDVLEHANFAHQAAGDLVVQQPTKWLVNGIHPSKSKQSKQERNPFWED